MGDIVEITKGQINPQNIGGIRDGDGDCDCGHVDAEPLESNENSPA